MNEYQDTFSDSNSFDDTLWIDESNTNIEVTNEKMIEIIKNGTYELLNPSINKLDIGDKKTFTELINLILKDANHITYCLHRDNFYFSIEELDSIFNIIFEKYGYSDELDKFFDDFFQNKQEINEFVNRHEEFFANYIKNLDYYSHNLRETDNFISLIIKNKKVESIKDLDQYTAYNLKLLSKLMKKENFIVKYYEANTQFLEHLFKLKNELEEDEFCELLNNFSDKGTYDRKKSDNEETSFSTLIKENIDYLISIVTKTKKVPKCLIESSIFRDECIKRNRIDLATKCILPKNIIENDELLTKYCYELNINKEDFYKRYKWIMTYYKKNNNIFNTILASSLKDNIFSIKEEHCERFINDVDIQILISKLDDKELIVFNKILNMYDYKDYDISLMVVNILKNISKYKDLIIELENNSSQEDLKKFVSLLQISNNECDTKDIKSLRNINKIRKNLFEEKYKVSNIIDNKDSLLKILFNIDLKEATYIDYKYCHDNDNNKLLANLKDSELPKEIYNYLVLINKIIECNDKQELINIYRKFESIDVYNKDIPLEAYLRSEYTKLYSQSLYRIEEKNSIYGPKDNISTNVNYNGINVDVCIPRVNFNFFIHCIGSCSSAVDENYSVDWLYRPQLQDHFVACSYINEKRIFSLRQQGLVILGFSSLDSGEILAMGDTDIDSLGYYSMKYDGSRICQESNNGRARFFVPSEIVKPNHRSYNEIVIERRNVNKEKNSETKKKPDYIIMPYESIEKYGLNQLNDLFQKELSFISDEDRELIKNITSSKEISNLLNSKYENEINIQAKKNNVYPQKVLEEYTKLITNATYYEDCLKASSEFNIPLVVVDKTYYFKKYLIDLNMYDENTLEDIMDYYQKSYDSVKSNLYAAVISGKDVLEIINEKKETSIVMHF